MESSFLTRDQVLSLWSGSTDSDTLDYQRSNPRGHQIVRTHTKETTGIQDTTSPNHPVQDASSKQQTKQKYKTNHQQTGLPPHLALSIRGKINKQKLSTNLTLYEAYTNHWTNLRRAETKRRKEFNFPRSLVKGDLKHNNLKKNEKAEKYCTNEGAN